MNKKGFTLIEMLIVVTIIGILAAIIMPRFTSTTTTATKNAHKAIRATADSAFEMCKADNSVTTCLVAATTAVPAAFVLAGGVYSDYLPDFDVNCNNSTAKPWLFALATERIESVTHAGHE